MAGHGGSAAKKPRASAAADCITAVPLELRAQIASFLPYAQAAEISSLSRSWRDIHQRTPVVNLDLRDFLYWENYVFGKTDIHQRGLLDDDALTGLRVDLHRRAREGGRVDTLRLSYSVLDARMKRHADRIIDLADAPNIRLSVPYGGAAACNTPTPWAVDVPPSARDLKLMSGDLLAPTIAGPGAPFLRKLHLQRVELLNQWPQLPSLRALALSNVTVEAPLAPGEWCPLLEELSIWSSRMLHAHVDILLPLLRSLDMDEVDINPREKDSIAPFADVTIDAPSLEQLTVNCTSGWVVEFRSFTLRAPRLQHLHWYGQFAERVRVDVGRPGSVRKGEIAFTSNGEREVKEYRVQMMRMLEELLPGVAPERVPDVARPYMAVDKKTVLDEDIGEMIPEETLTCNLDGLMQSLDG